MGMYVWIQMYHKDQVVILTLKISCVPMNLKIFRLSTTVYDFFLLEITIFYVT